MSSVEPSIATTGTVAATTTSPSTTLPIPTTIAPEFVWSVDLIDEERLSHSWREGCPVPAAELRLVSINFIDFTGEVQTGQLVVHHEHAESVAGVFSQLFDIGYPLSTVIPVGDFDPEHINHPGQNNTTVFNCRYIAGTTTWSEHASGLAIDINPQLNPYVSGDVIDPAEAARYVDRSLDEPGMIHQNDDVVKAFAEIGWIWGGTWETKKDYHHFSETGR